MNRQWVWLCGLSLAAAAALVCAQEGSDEPAAESAKPAAPAEAGEEFATLKEKVSYGIGLNIGNGLLQQGFDAQDLDVDVSIMAEGFKDAVSRSKLRVSEEQLRAAMQEFGQQMEAKQAEQTAKRKAMGEQAKKEGEAFLAANAKKEGVKATASGLQYQIVKQGDGPRPKSTDVVTVHYKGTLINGEEFDSSHKRGEPATFRLDRVIPGWTEGLQLMPLGSTYKLFIPYELGYGAQGSPPVIPGYSVLVFEVELLEIAK
jgi:FKBP-type peptidyl-prolyl cis-trans isomerase